MLIALAWAALIAICLRHPTRTLLLRLMYSSSTLLSHLLLSIHMHFYATFKRAHAVPMFIIVTVPVVDEGNVINNSLSWKLVRCTKLEC